MAKSHMAGQNELLSFRVQLGCLRRHVSMQQKASSVPYLSRLGKALAAAYLTSKATGGSGELLGPYFAAMRLQGWSIRCPSSHPMPSRRRIYRPAALHPSAERVGVKLPRCKDDTGSSGIAILTSHPRCQLAWLAGAA